MSAYMHQRWVRTRRLRRVACALVFGLELAGGVCVGLMLWHLVGRGGA